MAKTTIIGIDCATDPKKVGLAKGIFVDDRFEIVDARCGETRGQLLSLLTEWLKRESRVLLALDAPLGWPCALGHALVDHSAGIPIGESADMLFRRETDRLITNRCGRRPLDVGADRIARTAHAALNLIGHLAVIIGQIPLAWESDFPSRVAAIEVYPAATLSGRGIRCTEYKDVTHVETRQDIIDKLTEHLLCSVRREILVEDADVLDAVVCALAGVDFVRGHAFQPPDPLLARKEGWIWAKLPLRD